MRSNKTPRLESMTTRQKVIAIIVVLVILLIIWEMVGMLRGGSNKITPVAVNPKAMNNSAQTGIPKPAQLPKQVTMSAQEESALVKLQQDTQAKYIEALNELQMLRLQRDIAQTDQAIAAAKLATVTAQKSIVTMLSTTNPPTGAAYGPSLVNPAGVTPQNTASQPPPVTTISYVVVSVSYVGGRWMAVLGYQNNLYSVHVGDILPPDQSKVISINKDGIYLSDKNNTRRKISLVPVI